MSAKLLQEIAEGLFPKNFTCDLCGKETFDDTNLCPDCRKKVTFNDGAPYAEERRRQTNCA